MDIKTQISATIKNAGNEHTIKLPNTNQELMAWVICLRKLIWDATGIVPSSQRLLCRTLWKGALNDDKLNFSKVKKNLLKRKPVVILCFEEERKVDKSNVVAGIKSGGDLPVQHQQQLFEEDVRIAVQRSAERRSEKEKRRKKEDERESARSKGFLEICEMEEKMAKTRKLRLILASKWRAIALKWHNELGTGYGHWICSSCTVSNVFQNKKCHVCKQVRKNTSHGRNMNSSAVVLPPILSIFGLEGFSGTSQVASIRAMLGSCYRLDDRSAHFLHLPTLLEGSTLCGSMGSSVLDGQVECAFAASKLSRVVVAVHPEVLKRGVPDWLIENYHVVENDVILVNDGTHYGIYVCNNTLQRGDVHECIAMRSWPKQTEEKSSDNSSTQLSFSYNNSSLCIWFVVDENQFKLKKAEQYKKGI
jgi:hypothetical protein